MKGVAAFHKVLIPNRGEIAVRVARTLRQLGIRSAVAYHVSEADSPAVKAADEAYPLSAEPPVAAFLDGEAIIRLAKRIGADAIHPGYGFLSENANFADAVTAAGIQFIGPPASAMRLMGDKIRSRDFVRSHGFQVSTSVEDEGEADDSFIRRAGALGYPLVIKPSGGGGGKGIQLAYRGEDMEGAVQQARSVAARSFKDDRLYAERYIERPRHIEVQVLADRYGNCVHLFERDCSVQRRFQKVVEESPAPGLDMALRARICDEAVGIARAAGYVNAGTVEFLLTPDGSFFFLEMNTRIQVEHPVTEMVTGIDLVAEQIAVARGERLRLSQADIVTRGAALECRIYAEDTDNDFLPATGKILVADMPACPGLRLDTGIGAGYEVTSAFDPMLAKLIAYGATRDEAIGKARAALEQTIILGVETNVAYLSRLLGHPAFAAALPSTRILDEQSDVLRGCPPGPELRTALVTAAALNHPEFLAGVKAVPYPYTRIGRWQN